MAVLDGEWSVERVAGALPPMIGVRKVIRGPRGETRVGPLRIPFEVDGLRLRYRPPLRCLVDVLEPDGAGSYTGRTTLLGRELGRFRLRRVS